MRTDKGAQPTIAGDYPHIYAPENLGDVFIVKDGSRVVSSTGIWINTVQVRGTQLRVAGINAVVTLPEYRRQGLGGNVMLAWQQHMSDQGCHLGFLGTGLYNWYRALGWERASVECWYAFDRGNIEYFPSLPEHVEVGRFHDLLRMRLADELLDIRHAEGLGGVRTPNLLRRLFVAKKVSSVYAARQGIRMAAYLFTRGDTVVEWGGEAALIAGLVRAWFKDTDEPAASTSGRDAEYPPVGQHSISLMAPAGGHPFVDLLESQRFPCHVHPRRMLYLVDPQAVLAAFGIGDIRISPEGESFIVERGADRITVDRHQLTKLLFGPERISDLGADLLPLPFWQWLLEHV